MTRSIYSNDGRVHILLASGYYIGQVRMMGYRHWLTVTGKCKRKETALARAVSKMKRHDYRARAVFVDSNPYYEPEVVMEAKRR